ncbi:MAG: DUF4296 domain-containing protein [Ignavibacteriales bacterium]|nr:DUF4296 domain-containing protein [Ignavibacteriales bacterium]
MKKINPTKVICFFVTAGLSLTILGCFGSDKIPEDDFIKIYTDIIIVQDTLKLSGEELLLHKKTILIKYNYTEQEYENTVNYYNEDVERWEIFFEKTLNYLEELKKKETPKP